MKLSNKILLGFFGCIILYTLLAAGEVRFRGNFRGDVREGLLIESVNIGGYKHLIINSSNIEVSIDQSDTTRIEVKSEKTEDDIKLTYRLSGDSLIIDSVNMTDEVDRIIKIYLDNRIETINSNAIRTYIRKFEIDSLTVIANAKYLSIGDDAEIKNLRLKGFDGANVFVFSEMIGFLDLKIDDANVTVRNELSEINAELVNGAVLSSKAPDNLQFKRDRDCKVIMYR
ncbi:MAG: hypothetical protein AAFQ94_14275 [Bacteroidota bacterium]